MKLFELFIYVICVSKYCLPTSYYYVQPMAPHSFLLTHALLNTVNFVLGNSTTLSFLFNKCVGFGSSSRIRWVIT